MTRPPDLESHPDLRRLYAVESVALLLIAAYVWLLDRFVSSTPLLEELLAVVAFAITWGCMVLIQIVSRFAPKTAERPV